MSPKRLRMLILVNWVVAWGDEREEHVIRDAAHLTELLWRAAEAAATSHTMVELVSPDGAACVIGLGRARSVATFQASADPPYYVSCGTGSEGEPLIFFFDGHWTSSAQEAIPVDDALAALLEYYATGTRPTLDWVEV